MKISTLADLLAAAGLLLIVSGLWQWHFYAALIFAGLVLVFLAHNFTRAEAAAHSKPAEE